MVLIPSIVFLMIFVFAIAFVSIRASEKARRRAGWKMFAEVCGLSFMDESLPHDLPLSSLDATPTWDGARYCISGLRKGVRVVFFEYDAGIGRQRRGHGLVAAQTSLSLEALEDRSRLRLKGFRDGPWLLATSWGLFGGLLSHEEVMRLWDEMARSPAAMNSSTR